MLRVADAVILHGGRLTIADVCAVAGGAPVELSATARRALARSAAMLARHLEAGTPIYGLNRGVGGLESYAVSDPARLSRNLIRSHAAGAGDPMDEAPVRAMMVCRLDALCGGASGASPALAFALAALLDAGVTPMVPALGSVGAADLAPLAHVGLVLMGEGEARFRGRVVSGGEALAAAGLAPWSPEGRDGLALLGGLAQSLGIAALVAGDCGRLIRWSEAAAALSTAAAGAPTSFLDPLSVASKPHPGAVASAAALARLLAGARGSAALRAPMSMRVAAHVAGTARELNGDLARVVERELAAPADNPMLGPGGRLCCNATGFDGHRLAAAIDAVCGALVSLAAAAERRVAQLMEPGVAGEAPYLIHPDAEPGLSSGLMIAHYTAAALVAEMSTGWRPVAGSSVPLANGSEDLVSMASIAARRAAWLCRLAARVVAIELLCAAQAADLAGAPLPPALAAVHGEVREVVAPHVEDRPVTGDVAALLARVLGDDLPEV